MNEITMTARSEVELVSNWLDAFEDALARCDRAAVDRIIADDCHWRDLLAFTWTSPRMRAVRLIVSTLAPASRGRRAQICPCGRSHAAAAGDPSRHSLDRSLLQLRDQGRAGSRPPAPGSRRARQGVGIHDLARGIEGSRGADRRASAQRYRPIRATSAGITGATCARTSKPSPTASRRCSSSAPGKRA